VIVIVDKKLSLVLAYHMGGRTNAWLARAIGMSPQHIGGILLDKQGASIEARAAMAKALELSPEDTLELMMAKVGGAK
jgi:transcriptional regulator with XRE-family HTH domain